MWSFHGNWEKSGHMPPGFAPAVEAVRKGVRMRTSTVARIALVLIAANLAALPPAPVSDVLAHAVGAATLVWVPAGTRVGLEFLTPVDSGQVTAGTKVHFKVIADVIGARHVIIRAGTPVTGTVTKVTKPGMFGASSEVVISFLAANAVDGRPIKLRDVVISKATVSNARVGAAGASAAGAVVLGPVGLLAGALVRGSYVRVPAGTVVTDTTSASVNVSAP